MSSENSSQYASSLQQYQHFWCPNVHLQGVISCQKHFEVEDSDIFLAAIPKSGTTWLKAIMFALLNRKPHAKHDHPLLSHNPQDLVPLLEAAFRSGALQIPDIVSSPSSSSSPRLFSTHIPYPSLPECVKSCKFVYLCRNPKDTLVSLSNFLNKLNAQNGGEDFFGDVVDHFCTGFSPYGPYWDHVLQYWKQSREDPSRVFFIKYEEMKEQPGIHLRRLAGFLGCPFSADEEESGLADEILNLCSFDNLTGLEVNKNGKLALSGLANQAFFHRGKVGDWKNHFSTEMSEKIDRIMEQKLHGSGLEL